MAQINTLTTTQSVEVVSGVEAKSGSTGRRVTVTQSKRRPESLVVKAYGKDGAKVFGLYLSADEAIEFASQLLEFAIDAQ